MISTRMQHGTVHTPQDHDTRDETIRQTCESGRDKYDTGIKQASPKNQRQIDGKEEP